MTCFETKIGGFTIALQQTSKNFFTVVYGKQVFKKMSYVKASHELGECIMHALACDALINVEGR